VALGTLKPAGSGLRFFRKERAFLEGHAKS
jgi:hypothetical protein